MRAKYSFAARGKVGKIARFVRVTCSEIYPQEITEKFDSGVTRGILRVEIEGQSVPKRGLHVSHRGGIVQFLIA